MSQDPFGHSRWSCAEWIIYRHFRNRLFGNSLPTPWSFVCPLCVSPFLCRTIPLTVISCPLQKPFRVHTHTHTLPSWLNHFNWLYCTLCLLLINIQNAHTLCHSEISVHERWSNIYWDIVFDTNCHCTVWPSNGRRILCASERSAQCGFSSPFVFVTTRCIF